MKKRMSTIDIKNLMTVGLVIVTILAVAVCVKSFDIEKKRRNLEYDDQKVMVEISTEDEGETSDGTVKNSTKEKVTVYTGDDMK